MKRELFDIWQEQEPKIPELPWRAQLDGYVAQFPNQAAAERYVTAVKVQQAKWQTINQAL
jgi:hypothetical protein